MKELIIIGAGLWSGSTAICSRYENCIESIEWNIAGLLTTICRHWTGMNVNINIGEDSEHVVDSDHVYICAIETPVIK
jgi:hypothetical protein